MRKVGTGAIIPCEVQHDNIVKKEEHSLLSKSPRRSSAERDSLPDLSFELLHDIFEELLTPGLWALVKVIGLVRRGASAGQPGNGRTGTRRLRTFHSFEPRSIFFDQLPAERRARFGQRAGAAGACSLRRGNLSFLRVRHRGGSSAAFRQPHRFLHHLP